MDPTLTLVRVRNDLQDVALPAVGQRGLGSVMSAQLELDPIVLWILHDDELGDASSAPTASRCASQGLLDAGCRHAPGPIDVLLAVQTPATESRPNMVFGDSVAEQTGGFGRCDHPLVGVTHCWRVQVESALFPEPFSTKTIGCGRRRHEGQAGGCRPWFRHRSQFV